MSNSLGFLELGRPSAFTCWGILEFNGYYLNEISIVNIWIFFLKCSFSDDSLFTYGQSILCTEQRYEHNYKTIWWYGKFWYGSICLVRVFIGPLSSQGKDLIAKAMSDLSNDSTDTIFLPLLLLYECTS